MRLEPVDRFPTVRHLAATLLPFASDKSRVVWSETFGVADNPLVGTPPPAPNVAPGRKVSSVSGTCILPPSGSSFSSGRSVPTGNGTTLGSATGRTWHAGAGRVESAVVPRPWKTE
jgi:hypothetical protein